jgi:hypothetical protein
MQILPFQRELEMMPAKKEFELLVFVVLQM